MHSMTGQGACTVELGAAMVHAEVRAVNHRWLEIRSRIAPELEGHAAVIEDTVRRMLVRGRIDVQIRIEGETSAPARLDVARAREALSALRELRDSLAPGEALPLSLLGSVPGLFVPGALGHERARDAVLRATERACTAVAEMRAREGQALAQDFTSRAHRLLGLVDVVVRRGPVVLEAARKRLAERLERVALDGALDAQRIEQEIVVLADRSDVCEECTRLRSHVSQLEELVLGADPGTLVGRRLEFLLQEMARESNTLGQKSADVEIARAVIELKVEIERMREQAQNVL